MWQSGSKVCNEDVDDRIRLKINNEIDVIDALYRIGVINVRISASDEEEIELEFASHDDVGTPISFIEELVENLETAS